MRSAYLRTALEQYQYLCSHRTPNAHQCEQKACRGALVKKSHGPVGHEMTSEDHLDVSTTTYLVHSSDPCSYSIAFYIGYAGLIFPYTTF